MSENQKKFEISYLVRAETSKETILKILTEIGASNIVDGKLTEIKLSYPIKKHTSAFFSSFVFEVDPLLIDKLDKSLKFTEEILRFLIISIPPKKTPPRFSGDYLAGKTKINHVINVDSVENIKTPVEKETENTELINNELPEISNDIKTDINNDFFDEKLEEILISTKEK